MTAQGERAQDDGDLAMFAGYHLHEELGRGGMAMVHRAELIGPGGASKEVALKRILPQPGAPEPDDEGANTGALFVERFISEMTIAAKLSHPNIVHVLNFGVDDGTHYIVLELIRGMDLRTLMKKLRRIATGQQPLRRESDDDARELFARYQDVFARRVLPEHLAAFIALEIAEGLAYAHQHTVHRDLSEDNTMLSVAGEVKINDWGIAKAKRAGENLVTKTERAYGKLAYMAPEQFRGKALDGRADLYSLGIILFRLLSGGRHPYDKPNAPREDAVNRAFRAAMRERGPIAEMLPGASLGMHVMLEALIEPDIEKRPASAAELLRTLKQMVGDVYDARHELRQLVRLVYDPDAKTPRATEAAGPQSTPSSPGSDGHQIASHVTMREPEPPEAPQRKPVDSLAPTNEREPAPATRKDPVERTAALDSIGPTTSEPAQATEPTPRSRVPLRLALGAAALVLTGLLAFTVAFFTGPFGGHDGAAIPTTPASADTSSTPHIAQPPAHRAEEQAPTPEPTTPAVPAPAVPDESAATPSAEVPSPDESAATPAEALPTETDTASEAEAAEPPATGRLRVFVVPFGRVTLDGRPITVRRTYRLEPGTYRVAAVYERRREVRTVRIAAGQLERVTFRFLGER